MMKYPSYKIRHDHISNHIRLCVSNSGLPFTWIPTDTLYNSIREAEQDARRIGYVDAYQSDQGYFHTLLRAILP